MDEHTFELDDRVYRVRGLEQAKALMEPILGGDDIPPQTLKLLQMLLELPGVCASKSICFFCSKLNRRYRRIVFTDLSISDIYLHLHVGGVRSLRGLQHFKRK